MKKIKFTLIKFEGTLILQINEQIGYRSDSVFKINTKIGLIKIYICSYPEADIENDGYVLYLRGCEEYKNHYLCKIHTTKNGFSTNDVYDSIVYALKMSTKLESKDFDSVENF